MTATIYLKALVLWFAILLCAIVNGAVREMLLLSWLGTVAGFIVSGLLLSGCILLAATLAAPWYGRLASVQYLRLGLFWLVLTLVFEFGFGMVQHKSWSDMMQPYTFHDGNLWPVVLVVTLTAPWLAAKWRGLM